MAERIGDYEVIRRLAQGGMAEVLLARQRGMGGFERLVCLKRILPHLRGRDDFVKMFQDEARIAANLIHPNIAQIYAIDHDDDALYIAMEYVRGEDLRRIYNQEVSRGRTLPAHVAAQIVMGAAAGLDYAHRQTNLSGKPLGLVHRDISPQNVIVTYDGHVKIIDFGVAKAADKLNETRSGVLKGKYSYMSPEQASGQAVDGRTDIFALGITLYEVTCGTRLFKRENELETLHAVIACQVQPPRATVPDFSPDLEAIIMRALSFDPKDRFASAGEMEQALEQFLGRQGRPTSASQLAAYMQELFADKLADEALFEGPPWNEAETGEARRRRLAETVARGPMPVATQVEAAALRADDWSTEAATEDQTGKLYLPTRGIKGARAAMRQPTLQDGLGDPAALAGLQMGPEQGLGTLPVDRPPMPPLSPASAWPRRWGWGLTAASVLVAAIIGAASLWRRRPADSRAAVTPSQAEHPIDPHHALLTVTAPIPLAVTMGNRFLGDTPLRRLPVEPGSYRLRLEGKAQGLVLRRTVRLAGGAMTHVHIGDQRGHLEVWGRPWAWVQMGLDAPRETPLALDLLEGEYSITFECPDGRRQAAVAEVVAGGRATTGIDCRQPPAGG